MYDERSQGGCSRREQKLRMFLQGTCRSPRPHTPHMGTSWACRIIMRIAQRAVSKYSCVYKRPLAVSNGALTLFSPPLSFPPVVRSRRPLSFLLLTQLVCLCCFSCSNSTASLCLCTSLGSSFYQRTHPPVVVSHFSKTQTTWSESPLSSPSPSRALLPRPRSASTGVRSSSLSTSPRLASLTHFQ